MKEGIFVKRAKTNAIRSIKIPAIIDISQNMISRHNETMDETTASRRHQLNGRTEFRARPVDIKPMAAMRVNDEAIFWLLAGEIPGNNHESKPEKYVAKTGSGFFGFGTNVNIACTSPWKMRNTANIVVNIELLTKD
jgi:hypothetical protein